MSASVGFIALVQQLINPSANILKEKLGEYNHDFSKICKRTQKSRC